MSRQVVPRASAEMLMPRYTQTVSRLRQIAAVVLIVLLAGGPALASVCEAVCVPPAARTQPTAAEEAHSRGGHHQAAAQPPADVQDTAARHHHDSGAVATASSRVSHVGRLLGRDCCTVLAPPRPSLTASRVDTDLLPGSHAAVVPSAAMLPMRDRRPAGPTHGPPTGDWSPVRKSLVLRI
jgi:hypothetical protein